MASLPPAPYGADYHDVAGEVPDIQILELPEDVWPLGGVYPWPDSALTTTVVSDSAEDASGGTGASVVEILGLSGDGYHQTQRAALQGLTPVELSIDLWRVYHAYALVVGTNEANVGNIDVKHGATTIFRITANRGQGQTGLYTIPANYSQGWLIDGFFGLGKTSTHDYARLCFCFRPYGGPWRVFQGFYPQTNATSMFYRPFDSRIRIPPLADTRVRVSEATANGLEVVAGYSIRLDKKPSFQLEGVTTSFPPVY